MKTKPLKGTKQNATKRQLTCDVCKDQFRCKADLEVHLRSHASETPALCELCGKGFSQVGSLNRHRNLCQVLQGQPNSGHEDTDSGVFTSEKCLRCHICEEVFEYPRTLKSHMYTHIEGETLHHCPLCNKRYTNKGALQSHLLVHNGVKPFKCKLCDKKFTQNSHRNVHMRTFHCVQSHMCEMCRKTFPSKSNLLRHMKLHTGIKQYRCDVCKREFLQRYELTKHMQYKENGNRHKCEKCDQLFCTLYDLRIHMKKHSKDKDVGKSKNNDRTSVKATENSCEHNVNVPKEVSNQETESECLKDSLEDAEDIDDIDVVTGELESDEPMYVATKISLANETNDRSQNEHIFENFANCNSVPCLQTENDQDIEDTKMRLSNVIGAGMDNEQVNSGSAMVKKAEQSQSAETTADIPADVSKADTATHLLDSKTDARKVLIHNEQRYSEENINELCRKDYQDEHIPKDVPIVENIYVVGQSNTIENKSDTGIDDHVKSLSEQNTKHQEHFQGPTINICSQDNYKLCSFSGSYVQSAQPSCVVKICSEKSIDTMQTKQNTVSNTNVSECNNLDSQIQHNKKDVLISGGMPDIHDVCKMYANTAMNEKAKENPNGESVQYGPVNIWSTTVDNVEFGPENICDVRYQSSTPVHYGPANIFDGDLSPTNNKDTKFDLGYRTVSPIKSGPSNISDVQRHPNPNESHFFAASKSNDDLSFHGNELNDETNVHRVQYGPENVWPTTVDNVEFGPENIWDARYNINKSSTPVKYGPANVFYGELGPTHIKNTEKDLGHRSVSPITSNIGDETNVNRVQHGPVNIWPTSVDNVEFSASSKNTDEFNFHGNGLNDDSNVNRAHFGPENLNEVTYGPAILHDIPYSSAILNDMQYDPASSHKQQDGLVNLNNIQCGPRNWNDVHNVSSSLNDVHYGPENLNEIKYGPVNLNDIQFGPANFNEEASDTSDMYNVQYKPTCSSLDEELFIPFGPPNIYDLKEDNFDCTGTQLEKSVTSSTSKDRTAKEEKTVTDMLNSSLMNFPHLNSKGHDNSDMFQGHVSSKQQSSTDYTTVGGLNLGPVHELTGMIVHSCEQAGSSDTYKSIYGNELATNKVESGRTEMRVDSFEQAGSSDTYKSMYDNELAPNKVPVPEESGKTEMRVHSCEQACSSETYKSIYGNELAQNKVPVPEESGKTEMRVHSCEQACSSETYKSMYGNELAPSEERMESGKTEMRVHSCEQAAPSDPFKSIYGNELAQNKVPVESGTTDMNVQSYEQASSSDPYNGSEESACLQDSVPGISGYNVPPNQTLMESGRPEMRQSNKTLVWNTANTKKRVPTKQLSEKYESDQTVLKEASSSQNETLAATSELCSIIGGTMDTSSQKEMVGGHRMTSNNSYLCEICSKVINSQQNMDQHMLTHSKARPFSCKICAKTFTGLGSLNHHYKLCKVLHLNNRYSASSKSVNSGNEESQCYSASGKSGNSGIEESQFVCNFCKEGFSHKQLLKKHMVTHVNQRLYKCETCGELFRTKGTLQSHMRTHTGERPFACHLCEKSYQQNSQLTVHIRASHTKEKPFVCSICSKTFSDRSNYNRHMSTHSGEKSFVCEICKKSFGQKCNLKKHMLIHCEVKTDLCDICKKSFSTKANLKRHMLSHTVCHMK